MRSCRSCKFLAVELDAAGRRTPKKYRVYNCTVPLPVLPPLPASIHHSYRPPEKTMLTPDDGANCPLYEKLK